MRAVRAFDMNLEITKLTATVRFAPREPFSLSQLLGLQWVMATECVLCLWRKTERWQKSFFSPVAAFQGPPSPILLWGLGMP